MNTIIYFIRHAASPFSLGNERARGLSEQGKLDAHKSAQMLISEEIEVIRPIASLEYEGKKIVIGTHGNIMTIIMNYYDRNYGYPFWKQTTKPDIYKLFFESKELKQVERLWKV
jgi:broad specificity phosphatase PhoE